LINKLITKRQKNIYNYCKIIVIRGYITIYTFKINIYYLQIYLANQYIIYIYILNKN